jgi:hypothetical protein
MFDEIPIISQQFFLHLDKFILKFIGKVHALQYIKKNFERKNDLKEIHLLYVRAYYLAYYVVIVKLW